MTARQLPQAQPPAETPQAADNPPQDVAPPADAVPAEPASTPPPATADRQLQEMPENFRAGFPALTVDVHVYNSDPQRRFVLVGGKRYHEGDTLAEGPRIVSIVPDGLVFDWQVTNLCGHRRGFPSAQHVVQLPEIALAYRLLDIYCFDRFHRSLIRFDSPTSL